MSRSGHQLFVSKHACHVGGEATDPAAALVPQACWEPTQLAADAADGLPVTPHVPFAGDPLGELASTARRDYPHTRLLGSTHVVGAWSSRDRAAEVTRSRYRLALGHCAHRDSPLS